ncbi:MAG: hypothetical protein MJ237_01020 [bacterium]|nr:hypothetical protein [bacterium]
MNNNNSDTFEFTAGNKKNFFLNADTNGISQSLPEQTHGIKHLNDYDHNLLEEDAYKDIDDNTLKLEYKISKTEKAIQNVDLQISSAREINDIKLINDLENQKTLLVKEYNNLIATYNKSMPAKISDSIMEFFGKIFNKNSINNSSYSNFETKFLSRMPKKILSNIELRKSLNKLENINKSVDELIKLDIPIGDNTDKYMQLSKYIIKANAIQSQIRKYLKEN